MNKKEAKKKTTIIIENNRQSLTVEDSTHKSETKISADSIKINCSTILV